MIERSDAVRRIHASLERERAVDLHRSPIGIDFHDGTAVLSGEVESIGAKRMAVRCAAGLEFVYAVDDRLRVHPAQQRGDGAIKDSLAQAFRDPLFQRCRIRLHWNNQVESLADTESDDPCRLEISVRDGAVDLGGTVWSHSHRRLAEAFCWWSPGVADVSVRLQVVPPEDDGDAEINDALNLVLAKDPLLKGDELYVVTRDRVVTLRGVVRAPQERQMAENDAWYVSGVERVVNELEVAAGPRF